MKPNDKHPTGALGNHPPNEGENFSITEETLLRASRFRVDRVRQTFADGRIVEREVIRHPGAVVIVPVLDDGRICLIRNYRVAVGSWLLELPAGTLEPHEPPSQTAERELIEETGYRASRIEPLCQLLMSPGILHERMHAFVATGLSDGDAAREEGELIVNHLMSLDEVDVALRTQQIEDAKTIAALLYYLRYYSR
ncbi:MAG: NUDIX hydrolase [Aureliella sp.]